MGKISTRTEKTTIHDTDLFPMVDIEATPDETKKITGANLRAAIRGIQDADGDTKIQAEESADEDKIRMDVAGVEAFVLSAIGELTLAKQSNGFIKSSTAQNTPANTQVYAYLEAEITDTQNEFDVSIVTGSATATSAGKLVDSAANFVAGDLGRKVWNTTDNTYSYVTAVDSSTQLSLNNDIMASGEGYKLYFSKFTAKEDGKYIICGSVRLGNVAGSGRMAINIMKNGVAQSEAEVYCATGLYPAAVALTVLSLVANDYVQLAPYPVTGQPEVTYTASNSVFLAVVKVA